METKKFRILALAVCLFSLSVLFLLLSMTGPVEAGPLLQEPPPEEGQPPVGPFEPAVFPEGPGEDEEVEAQGGVEPAAYIISPTMNYQGYLADAGGNPIDATLTFTASLYDDLTAGVQEWGPEVHSGVSVQNGLFSLVLGYDVPLDPADFYEALYLALEVDGTTLPRQTLRTVPYAFSLVQGARLRGNLDNVTLWVQENGPGDYGLGADRIYSSEGYASGADSFLWVPGNLAVTNEPANVTLRPDNYYGRVEASTVAVGGRHVLMPIAIPAVLYGHNVVVEEVRVYYYTSNANTYIDGTYVNKLTGAGASDYEAIASINTPNQSSTTATYYNVPIDATKNYTLTSGSGPLTLNIYIHFDNVGHSVHIGGVRVRLGHPRSDQ